MSIHIFCSTPSPLTTFSFLVSKACATWSTPDTHADYNQSSITLGSLYGENVTSKKFRCFLSFLSQKHCAYLSIHTQTTHTSHQTVTEVQMCDHAGTKHSPEQPRRCVWRPWTGNLLREPGTQQLHGTQSESAGISRAQHGRKDTANFDVWTPWGCGAFGCPRPWRAAQTAPHTVSAVSAG